MVEIGHLYALANAWSGNPLLHNASFVNCKIRYLHFMLYYLYSVIIDCTQSSLSLQTAITKCLSVMLKNHD